MTYSWTTPWGGFGFPVATYVTGANGQVKGVIISNNNNFGLGFSLAGGFPVVGYGPNASPYKYPQGLNRSFAHPYTDASGNWHNPYAVVGPDQTYVVDPMTTSAGAPMVQSGDGSQQQRELTLLERADLTLHSGNAPAAIKLYRAYLDKYPDDAAASRSLAMALVDDHRIDQAVAVLALSYERQPRLAGTPIDPDTLSGSDMTHRRRFTAVMDYANRTKTASAYFAAAVLAQSEDRDGTAARLLDKAMQAGLNPRVGEEMKLALAVR